MATSPQFGATAYLGALGQAMTAANTAMDGTGSTGRVLVATAAANGAFIDRIVMRGKGTNTASVVRVFINNGSDPEVAGNNSLYTEKTLAATTASNVAALADNQIPLNLPLPAGYRIYLTLGTAVAAGWMPTVVGGSL